MFEVTFSHKTKIAKNIYSFYFESSSPLRFIAGQFIELKLAHEFPDNRGEKRWFTISSPPDQKLLAISTRFADHHSSTYKQALQNLKPGTTLQMAQPMGDFVLPKDPSTPLLFVAGGMGCTPFHSIAEHLNHIGEKRDIKMIYAAKELEDVAFIQTFQTIPGFEIILSNPGDDWQGKTGHISSQDIIALSENGKRSIYLSGPEPMVEIIDKELKEADLSPSLIHTDFFPGYETI